MDRRGWPWKKKSSEKTGTDKQAVVSDGTSASLSSLASLGDQEKCKKVNYVQISMESYVHLTGLEDEVKKLKDQVRLCEDEVKNLKGKLSEADTEIKSKDGLISQHAKVAEEAVSGWEKADAEAFALKRQLENLTLLKLSVEDRAAHLDGALKECMRQVRNVKEESEHKFHDVVLAKTIQWDKVKLGLEAKIAELDEGLLRAAAENQALSSSLHERSNLIVQIEVEKSKAEAEMELIKENLMSREKEISSLKYELHMVSKELEIRNEEKNISVRSAEAANKQHLASVRKIAKLEAECQRLRGLVRKRLPGPAALAQMKQEIDHFGRDFGGPQSKRNAVKNPNPNLSPQMEFSAGNLLQSQKEIDYLTMRLLEMEEETKMLKEALASRNSELQAARDMCAKTSVKVKSLEAQIQALNNQTSSPKSSIGHRAGDLSSQYASNAPSITSMSEDGVDVEGRSAESLLPVTSDISHLGMQKSSHKVHKQENPNCLELMDDFLEMEKLACLPNDAGGANDVSSHPGNYGNYRAEGNTSRNAVQDQDLFSVQEFGFSPSSKQGSSSARSSTTELQQDVENLPFLKLRSMISLIFESQTKDLNLGKVLEDIKCAILEIQGSLPQHCLYEGVQAGHGPSDPKDVSGQSLIFLDEENITKKNLASAISQIHQVVLSIGREAMRVQDPPTDGHRLSKKLDDFSAFVDKFVFDKKGLVDFILRLSHVFAEADRLNLGFLGYMDYDRNASDNHCIDKVALLENKVVQDNPLKHACGGGCHLCHSCPDSEVIRISDPSFQPSATSCSCLLKELEQLKLDKQNITVDLARSTEDLENVKLLLQETENDLTELKLQLASSQNLHSLAETQLKCMTESYKSLELRAQELEAEVNLLQEKSAKLDDELLEEKRGHQDALARCEDLEDRVQRNVASFFCPSSAIGDSEMKMKQERELKDAAQKLAACQETIYLLGRQLQSLHPQTENHQTHHSDKLSGENSAEGRLNHSGSKAQDIHHIDDFDRIETDSVASADVQSVSEDSLHYSHSTPSPFDNEPNLSSSSLTSLSHLSHRRTKSTFSASTLEREKHLHSFGRLFSLEGKNEQ
ncbi:hypothetical protein ERO13_D11G045000v2 [Gossypium hirsutum]|uniref:Filament-like plant protein 5 n=1 Tax=Gossypium hirsutum TaxID=3635 RepID=A0A1U8K4L2_GOSHI|nr:filament-like plant protein 5 [Gossypium hirsutum]KAG4118870.1 hypothetical protein ERO13_D11G045000v2 [Gossypium hirsutum]